MGMPEGVAPVFVIGAGPGGLAVAACLRRRGAPAVVLDKEGVAASWRRHYDRLRLHTTRGLSTLPGMRIPREYGRWIARDDVVRYLEAYAAHHRLDVRAPVTVVRIDRATDDSSARWLIRTVESGDLAARAVVVATGYNHTPRLPTWPGADTFTGELLHAAQYRNPAPFSGRDVLVVGVGNTGAEVAQDLAAPSDGIAPAARVRLAVRTPPHIVLRDQGPWAAQYTGVLVRRLPVRFVDRLSFLVRAMTIPDLAPFGLPAPAVGLATRAREGAIPVQDVGIVDAVRTGKVEVVGDVLGFDGADVRLADGSRVAPDVVIAATGYEHGLEPLVGHLGVLDDTGRPFVHGARTMPSAPGLWFTGYTNPLSGMLREIAMDARRISRAVVREQQAS